MKILKILIILLLTLFSFCKSSAQEVKELYIVQKMPRENLANIVKLCSNSQKYSNLSKENFYLQPPAAALSSPVEIITEQNGFDSYFYYYSISEDKTLETAILDQLKKGRCKVKKIEDYEKISAFDKNAFEMERNIQETMKASRKYDFSDSAQQVYDRSRNTTQQLPIAAVYEQKAPQNTTVQPVKYSVIKSGVEKTKVLTNQITPKVFISKSGGIALPQGASFDVTLQSAISSGSMSESDRITAVLKNDFLSNGVLVFPAETIFYGTATKAGAATGGYGNGSLEIEFNQVLTPDGQRLNISTNKITYAKKAERALNITRDVVVGAGLGTLTGLLMAAYTGNYAEGALIGASIGAAGGGLYSAQKKGEEIEIPEGTVLHLILNQPINISQYNLAK